MSERGTHASAANDVEPRGLPAENDEVHTRILRLALGVEESRAYFERVDPSVPMSARATDAFEGRWFGNKSLARVRTLLGNFAVRYDAYPAALETLRAWSTPATNGGLPMEAETRRLVCHWHLQLADPMYRRFTGDFLPRRHLLSRPSVGREVVLAWLQDAYAERRWSPATCVQFGSKLLSAAAEAGLVSPAGAQRTPVFPRVDDAALGYVLHLLRETVFAGTLTDNPYLASVGLTENLLDYRLRALPGLRYRRMAQLQEWTWSSSCLTRWGETLAGGASGALR